jgi:hypothetical protein
VALVSSLFVLGGIEAALRFYGHAWWFNRLDANEPTTNVRDPVLGWMSKPGAHVIPPYTPGARPIRITNLSDGTRSTGHEAGRGRVELFFTGASFTQGWAVSDHETFAWKVQERFPELRVRNFGTAGYSTFQSLLSLEKRLAQGSRPDWVFYSLSDVLEERNVAAPHWLLLLARFSKRGAVDVPFCTLREDGQLNRHPPERYPEWPLRGHLASVALAERVYAERRGKARSLQERPVTKELLLEMGRLVESSGARFTVVLLHFAEPDSKVGYTEFLQSNAIDFVDCTFPLTPRMRVPGEGHPNGKMHSRWANCIAVEIEKRLPEVQQARPSTHDASLPAALRRSVPDPASDSG